MSSSVHEVQIVLIILLAFVIFFAVIARRLSIPYPIVMVAGGVMVGFIPGLPRIALNPELIFLLVLPPLLYSAAWQTSWRDFHHHLVSILLLAFGLVTFTVFAVAALAPRLFAGFDWRTGFVLGAAIATTDAIAATTIARRVGLPRRIIDVIEGESLVNDATGLLMLEFGIAMVVSGESPAVGYGMLRLAWLVAAGVAVGIAIALLVYWLEQMIDDGPVEITVSLLVPYASYFAAEAVDASGVLAVVASGLYLGRHSSRLFSPAVRIEIFAVWTALTFLLNGFVFVMVGLQWPYVLAGIQGISALQMLVYGAIFGGLVIALRLIWIYPGAALAHLIRTRLLHQHLQFPSGRAIFVAGWSGMRGVIALAAAMSLPVDFPQRNMIVFLTFSVIFITVVLQGLTLPPLIRALGLGATAVPHVEQAEARRIIGEAALAHLESTRSKRPAFSDVYDDLWQHYSTRLAVIRGDGADEHGSSSEHEKQHRDLSLALLRVERETAIRLRDEGRIGDDLLRELQQEADLAELRLSAESNREV